MRRRLVFLTLICFVMAGMLPSSARATSRAGVAVLDIDCDNLQRLTPGPYYGGVSYSAQASNPNDLTVVVHPGSKLDFSDPDVAIVTDDPGCTSPWWCTPGLGSAHCEWARSLYVDGGDGNDIIRVENTTLYAIQGVVVAGGAGDDDITLRTASADFVRCGAGLDHATVSTPVHVDPDCEVVTRA